MKLLYKQLFRELLKNKIYTALLLVLTFCTSFMYFFVHFSIDGNRKILKGLASLSKEQLLYLNGLNSNTILAGNVLLAFTCMTGFVFSMFYYRFFKLENRQIGCLKALGFKDREIRSIFLIFTAAITAVGSLTGIGGGYFASDILISAGEQTYMLAGLIKALDGKSIFVRVMFPLTVFLLITFCNYFYIRRKESGLLLSGVIQKSKYTIGLRFANMIAEIFPPKNRSALRLALRKPVAVLLIIISVTSFSVMFILGKEVVIGAALNDIYGFQVGDRVMLSLDNSKYEVVISGIAFNAATDSVYISKQELAKHLSQPSDYCNGIWSMKDLNLGGDVITKAQRIDKLERDSVSNKSSAVINQVMGCAVGCILLFLALYINFQDSTRDILILHLMGYKVKEIRKMLINIYGPIMRISFILTLIPGIMLVRSILLTLSLQIGDYIPFQTNGFILVGIFVLLNLVYILVQGSFHAGVKRIIRNEDFATYTT